MSAITIKNLTKKFATFTAVKDITFEVGENRIFGFLGPNGAGKTTTIRILAGLSKPTEGSVEICGQKVVFGESKNNCLIGYLPEQPSFYTWMTGKEYLNFTADTFGLRGNIKDKRVEKLLTLVNLCGAKNKRIGTYSNGMKQRLGIAQALINDPKVLIMDEPVSALDPIGRHEILKIIENLKQNKTIFLSTHILSDVDRICDDVAILKNGELVTVSPLSQLKEKYSKPVLEIDFSTNPEPLIHALLQEKWQKKIEKNSNSLKIWLADEKAIQENSPLKFFAEKNIGILKYNLAIPETEDLFIELTGK